MIDYLVDAFASLQEQLERLYMEAEIKSDESQAEIGLLLSREEDKLMVLENKIRKMF